MAELLKTYQAALVDDEVVESFQVSSTKIHFRASFGKRFRLPARTAPLSSHGELQERFANGAAICRTSKADSHGADSVEVLLIREPRNASFCCPAALRAASWTCVLQAIIAKAKKVSKQSPDFKADMEAFEGMLLALAAELKEEAATAEVCLKIFAVPAHRAVLSLEITVPASTKVSEYSLLPYTLSPASTFCNPIPGVACE